jgi:tetratricopeptide (TPR) repeat protein
LAINRDKVEAAAIKLLQQGKYDKAIIELKKLVDDDKTDVRTLLKLGDTYVKIGSKKESIDSYEKAAAIYTEQGFYLKAVAVFKQILRVDANIPELHLKLAELYQQLGLTSDALQHYQNVAVFHEQQGRPREALDMLKRMVDLDPDNIPSRIKLGELFASQGLQAEASEELRNALNFLKQQQRFDDYVRVGEKLVAYDQNALDIAKELAQIYMSRAQPQIALGKLQMCFKADPRNVDVLAMIAQAFLDMQQVPKTISVFKEMAKIYQADGQTDLATNTWERVLELAPGDEEAEEQLGRVSPAITAPAFSPQSYARSAPTVVAPAMAQAPMAGPKSSAVAPPRPNPEDEALQKLMTETDVYVKYGLRDKAIEHLQKVFALKPDHIPGLEKLKSLQLATKSPAVADTMQSLVRAAEEQGHPRADEWRTELASLGRAAPQAQPLPRPSTQPSIIVPVSSSPSQSQSGEGDFLITDDPSNSPFGDEPLLPSAGVGFSDSSGTINLDNASGIVELNPSDEELIAPSSSLMDELPPDESPADGFDDPAAAATRMSASSLSSPPLAPPPAASVIPRMPTGVMKAVAAEPLPSPPQPMAQAGFHLPPNTAPPIQEDAVDLHDADALVRRALQDISAEDVVAAADELLLEASADDIMSASGEGLPVDDNNGFEVSTGPSKNPVVTSRSSALHTTPTQSVLSDEDDIDRLAREAVADANRSLHNDVAATALMGLSDQELAELRAPGSDFDSMDSSGGMTTPSAAKPWATPTGSNTAPGTPSTKGALPPELSSSDSAGDDGFNEPTLALLPPSRSSDVVTDERPRRAPMTQPGLLANRPSTSSNEEFREAASFGDEDVDTFRGNPASLPRDAVPPAASLPSSPFASPTNSQPPITAPSVAPPPVVNGDFSEEFDPSSFDLPADVKALLRAGVPAPNDEALPDAPTSPSRAPAPRQLAQALPPEMNSDSFNDASQGEITLRGKLGLKDKAHGFENDPANQFFPDELEEAEFFIQNELLDEAKEIIATILEDVPDSARAQWMAQRIEAREKGEAEPPAPWEQRILEEVQQQLEDLGLGEEGAATKQAPGLHVDGEQQVSVEEVLSQFKKGVAETVPEDDAATHYELGIAYKEMGLHDDAVGEFQIASRAASRAVDARFMIGTVRREQGKLEDAVAAFEEAAGQANATKNQKAAADYDRGVVLEELGRGKEALRALKSAKLNGHAAPDLDRRISALIAKVGDVPLAEANGNGHAKPADKNAPSRGPKNIDYV